tara:strand:+ start:71 stop:1036 length:966 start_codon:yes stop_codon:yes gene_type:complete
MNKKSNSPLVSIAMCVYNGARYLEAQLESILCQTYSNIELVVIDDCSTDNSYEILNQFATKHSNITLQRNQVNIGYVKNFEKALKACQGEFIALSDQDDIWCSHKIQKQMDAIGSNILVYHDSQFMNEDGSKISKRMSNIINMVEGENPNKLLLFNSISGHSCLFHKNLLYYILPLESDYFHDHWLGYVAMNVGSVSYLPEILVQYRQHEHSSTDILNKRKVKDARYHENRDVRKLKGELRWLKKCQSFPYNNNQAFLDEFVTLFENRINDFISFQYFQFIRKHYSELHYIQKKRKGSKQGYIYRQVWGLKAKVIWGKLFG